MISSTGFFPDGKWHGMAQAMRTPEVGEQAIAGLERDGLRRRCCARPTPDSATTSWTSTSRDSPTTPASATPLELYRSGDFEKLAGYGGWPTSDVPALLIWGANDEFAPIAGAHRFERELPSTELVAIEDAGHFVWDEQPERCAAALTDFLGRLS